MSYINFVIPQSQGELLIDSDEQYFVRNIIGRKEIVQSLKTAKQVYKDEGPEYILENFDVYYSVLHHADTLQADIVFTAYEHLHKAAQDLNKSLGFLLEDKESITEEQKTKILNVLKMLMYIYTNIVTLIELKTETKKQQIINMKGRQRKKDADDEYNSIDRKSVLLTLNYIIQQEISFFWDPPVVDEVFVNTVSEVCYRFLESPSIKTDKEARVELWSIIGLLVKSYNHGMAFIVRIVQLIKLHEHLTACIPEGIEQLVETFHCKSLVRDLVREITEWQCDEKFTDSQGTKYCSKVLSDMASLMPNLMIPEVMYLNRYLAHDSHALRNSVLNVIVEVLLIVLTKEELTDEERESRDEFLLILLEHVSDTHSFVRSKVFQHWARLQKENAVPIKMQVVILEKAVLHLRDKAANVRKNAANCVIAFLEHNLYSSNLQLGKMREELTKHMDAVKILRAELVGIQVNTLRETSDEWGKHEEGLRATVELKLKQATQQGDLDIEITKETLPQIIRTRITSNKYEEAFRICRMAGKQIEEFREMRDQIEAEEEVDLFMVLLRTLFSDVHGQAEELAASVVNNNQHHPSQEELQRLDGLERTVDYYKDCVTFLEHIDRARKLMQELLYSASAGDMHEAVDFFVATFKFNIDNSLEDILEMLKIMGRGEQDRREIVLNAFKTIYLTTDATTRDAHTVLIVSRLIKLYQTVPFDNMTDMTLIISEWVSKGILDNSVIDTLWQYFTKKISVTDDDARAALALLTMAAQGRRTIISRNIKLVSTVAFGERGMNDLRLVTQACKILSVAGSEKQDITDKNPPFKIKAGDSIWKELGDILITFSTSKTKGYNNMLSAAICFIYKLCATPIKIIETLIKSIMTKIAEEYPSTEMMEKFIIIRCITMLGEVAVKHLNFLDEVIYKELKRRNYIREERKNEKGNKSFIDKSTVSRNSSRRHVNPLADVTGDNPDESILEGAQADDTDAEIISMILENKTVTENTGLGDLAHLIINVCKRPDLYGNEYIQCSAITALLRYMLVSNVFCENHIQFVFTVLERTPHEEVRIIILIHCSDLLEKCPNVIEPYTPRIYKKLQDPNVKVRKTTLFMLSNLILRDMIRVQGHISEMAKCIVDEEEELRELGKNFFVQLSHKANNLYNLLPDIFSHLSETAEEEQLRAIMKFLFGLIDKNKQMENLVDRFCAKFRLTESEDVAKNIAFSLSLIQYNDKGLRKLIDNFATYKHLVLVTDIYAIFKQIIANCNKTGKNEIKVLTAELDDKIKQMFEITDGAEVPELPRTAEFKKPKGRAAKKKVTRRKRRDTDSSGSDDEPEKENTIVNNGRKSAKKTPARGRGRAAKRAKSSSDDSDD